MTLRLSLGLLLLGFPATVGAAPIINEVAWMGTTVSANDEWIELYNPDTEEVSLEGWVLDALDGAPSIALSGAISAGGFYLLERTDDDSVPNIPADLIYTGSLGNTGETLRLKDASGQIVDLVESPDGWPAGDNTEKLTMERGADNNWHNSAAPDGTPKAANSQSSPPSEDEPSASDEPPADNPRDERAGRTPRDPRIVPPRPKRGEIRIHEILSNPRGPDIRGSFIELRNSSDKVFNLEGMQLRNKRGKVTTLPRFRLAPDFFFVLYPAEGELPLRNTDERLTLLNDAGTIIDQVDIKGSAPEEQSFNLTENGKYVWSDTMTPGELNSLPLNPVLPVIEFNVPTSTRPYVIVMLDASDSFDPENQSLSFTWDFGDGRIAAGAAARQLYTQPGDYTVTLTVETARFTTSTEEFSIRVIDPKPVEATASSTINVGENPIIVQSSPGGFIFITEVLPNPKGPDTENEFIEIFNADIMPVNLRGWQLDDEEGGSRPYTIQHDLILKPGQYVALLRSQTKLALNNDEDSVRLFAPNGELIDQMHYTSSKEDQSWVLDEQFNWQLSATPSPGEINILDQTVEPEPELEESPSTPPPPAQTASPEPAEVAAGRRLRYIVSSASALTVLSAGVILARKKRI